MFCPRCGKELKEGSKFCNSCGLNMQEIQNLAGGAEGTPAEPVFAEENLPYSGGYDEGSVAQGQAYASDGGVYDQEYNDAPSAKKPVKRFVPVIVAAVVAVLVLGLFIILGGPSGISERGLKFGFGKKAGSGLEGEFSSEGAVKANDAEESEEEEEEEKPSMGAGFVSETAIAGGKEEDLNEDDMAVAEPVAEAEAVPCTHEKLSFYESSNSRFDLDYEHDEDYISGKFHNYAAYYTKTPKFVVCEDCGDYVFESSLDSMSPFPQYDVFDFQYGISGLSLHYKLSPLSEEYRFRNLTISFTLAVYKGGEKQGDYYSYYYMVDDSGYAEDTIDFEKAVKEIYPDATEISLEDDYGQVNYYVNGRVYVNDGSGVYDRPELSVAFPDYILPNSSEEYLSREDLDWLGTDYSMLARNEIYARHGRKFTKPETRGYFETKNWYEPTIEPSDFSDNMLSEIELANIKLILEYEAERKATLYPVLSR